MSHPIASAVAWNPAAAGCSVKERESSFLSIWGIDWSAPEMGLYLRPMIWNGETMGNNLSSVDWNATSMGENIRTITERAGTTGQNLSPSDHKVTIMEKRLSAAIYNLSTNYRWMSLKLRIFWALQVIQAGYYPLLAVIGVPGKSHSPSLPLSLPLPLSISFFLSLPFWCWPRKHCLLS